MRAYINNHHGNGDACVRAPQCDGARGAIWRVRQLIVPVDFSAGSEKAIDYAVSLAKQTSASIRFVHVIEPRRLFHARSGMYAQYDRNLVADARQMLEEIAVSRCKNSIRMTCEVHIGHAADEICKSAEKFSKCLIVIATHGFTALKRILLGSTAALVVRHAPCPVLVVPARREKEAFKALSPQNILVPLDFAKHSADTLECAVALAKRTCAKVRLLHVVPGIGIDSSAERLLLEGRLKRAQQKTLDRLIAALTSTGLIIHTMLRHGDPGRQILLTANQLRSDLIVISAHGRKAFHRAFLGSTAEKVIGHARCPVLVCHPVKTKRITKPTFRDSIVRSLPVRFTPA